MTMETLRRAGENVLGVVLNRVPAKSEHHYDRYYGSHEAAADAGDHGAVSAAALRAARPRDQPRTRIATARACSTDAPL